MVPHSRAVYATGITLVSHGAGGAAGGGAVGEGGCLGFGDLAGGFGGGLVDVGAEFERGGAGSGGAFGC